MFWQEHSEVSWEFRLLLFWLLVFLYQARPAPSLWGNWGPSLQVVPTAALVGGLTFTQDRVCGPYAGPLLLRMFACVSANVYPTLELTSSLKGGRCPPEAQDEMYTLQAEQMVNTLQTQIFRQDFQMRTKEKNKPPTKPIKISLESTAKVKSKDLKEKMVTVSNSCLSTGQPSGDRKSSQRFLSLDHLVAGGLLWQYFANSVLILFKVQFQEIHKRHGEVRYAERSSESGHLNKRCALK